MFEPLIKLVVPHTVAGVCGPTCPGLRRVLVLPVPAAVGCHRHRHEDGASYFASALVSPTPRLLDECRRALPLLLGFAPAHRPILLRSAHPLPGVRARSPGPFQRTQRAPPNGFAADHFLRRIAAPDDSDVKRNDRTICEHDRAIRRDRLPAAKRALEVLRDFATHHQVRVQRGEQHRIHDSIVATHFVVMRHLLH